MTTERDLIQRLADALTNAIRVIHNEDGTQHISTAAPVLAEARAYLAQPEPEGLQTSALSCGNLNYRRLAMTDHPITPPPDLVQEWYHEANLSGAPYEDASGNWAYEQHIAARAAQWGADQERNASSNWLVLNGYGEAASRLRAARRPKPPSLKEQALETLEEAPGPDYPRAMTVLNADQHALIRRALEALPDD